MFSVYSLFGPLFLVGIAVVIVLIVVDLVRQNKEAGVLRFEREWVGRNLPGYNGGSETLFDDLRAVLESSGVSAGDFGDTSDSNLRRLIDRSNSNRRVRLESTDDELIPALRQVGADWKRETGAWAAALGVRRAGRRT